MIFQSYIYDGNLAKAATKITSKFSTFLEKDVKLGKFTGMNRLLTDTRKGMEQQFSGKRKSLKEDLKIKDNLF